MFKPNVLPLLAALALAPGAVHAASDLRTVTVEVDPDAGRLLRIYEIEAAVDTADKTFRGVGVREDDNGVTVAVIAPADAPKIAQDIRQRFEGRPGAHVSEQAGRALTAQLTAAAWAAHSPKEQDKAVYRLEQLLMTARAPVAGLQIESAPNGAVVRAADPALRSRLPKMIEDAFHQALAVQARADGAWFITMTQGRDAARTGRLNREMASLLDLYLREPLALQSSTEPFDEVRPPRTRIVLTQAQVDRPSIEAARRWIVQAGGQLEETPAELITISLDGAKREDYRPADPALFDEVTDLVQPAIAMTEAGDGVLVRAVDPARSRERAAELRHLLAGQPGLSLSDQADGALRIEPSPAVHDGPRPDEELVAAVRVRLQALRLGPTSVGAAGDGRVAAVFATAADADIFKRSLQAGAEAFAIRVVEGDPDAQAAAAPTPGDLRVPQARGGFVWVRPEAVITGAMLRKGSAAAAIDPYSNLPLVTFEFGPEGKRAFAAMTRSHVGKMFAVMSNGVAISTPMIMEPITGGAGQISGLNRREAAALAARMNAASDDLPLKLVEGPG